eukprot:TRINITY_DN36528_c0_g1_i1.p1 TRINITY_DN36528_c0_g1~~TRINITY_DN36528_c0_g1_i1.p1  ORF type:complete len:261 (+),score=48.53 TRINITY_DN36528_c0_g1_i1:267-1049(+)
MASESTPLNKVEFEPVESEKVHSHVDIEAGSPSDMLYPGIGMTSNELRWGFIRKVYGIIGIQLAFTAAVAAGFMLVPDMKGFLVQNTWFFICAMVLPFITMIPLYIYRHSHPLNLAFLSVWTLAMSLIVGVACSFERGPIVLEALVLTAAVVIALTAYTFHAAKKGEDFSYLGPMLWAGLMVLVMWSAIQLFFSPGAGVQFVFALGGALIFALYIIYDTDNMIKRYSYDEYVWASVGLYLDVLNLFLRLLEILGYLQRDG